MSHLGLKVKLAPVERQPVAAVPLSNFPMNEANILDVNKLGTNCKQAEKSEGH